MRKRVFVAAAILGLILWLVSRFLQPAPGRTNLLVLGVAGQNQAGSDLTDTIMFVSLDNQTGKTLLLSLPRDIWVPALRTKLNSVYHYRGAGETKKIVGEILGQPVTYEVMIDFTVFKKVVDSLGGVTVEVQNAFDDDKYPLPGKENDLCGGDKDFKCRYEHVRFEAGQQKMDGETALKYVRSRNAEGDEGTDFARSQRQQRLILALKSKILSPRFLLNPQRVWGFVKVVQESIKTDIPQDQFLALAKIALRIRSQKITTAVLNGGYLINPPASAKYDQQWVLVPQTGDWQAAQGYVRGLLEKK